MERSDARARPKMRFGAAPRRVLRWVPDRLPLRFAALQASGKALLRERAPIPSAAFPGACSESGMRPGTQRKTLPRSGAKLISRRSPKGEEPGVGAMGARAPQARRRSFRARWSRNNNVGIGSPLFGGAFDLGVPFR